jgi:hypothetical protein
MKPQLTLCIAVFGAAFTLVTRPVDAEEQAQLSLSASSDYGAEKFVAASTKKDLYALVTAKIDTERWGYKLSVPYLYSGPSSNVRLTNGAVNLGASGNSKGVNDLVLGEVTAAMTYRVPQRSVGSIQVELSTKAKFRSIDSPKSLIHAPNSDYSYVVDLTKDWGQLSGEAGASYNVPAKLDGGERTGVSGYVGAIYRFSKRSEFEVVYDYWQRETLTAQPGREVTLYYSHRVAQDLKLRAYAIKGFADGRADSGLGAMLSYSW